MSASIHRLISLSPLSYVDSPALKWKEWVECEVTGDGWEGASNMAEGGRHSPATLAMESLASSAPTISLTLHCVAPNIKGAADTFHFLALNQSPIYIKTAYWTVMASINSVVGPTYRAGSKGKVATFKIEASGL